MPSLSVEGSFLQHYYSCLVYPEKYEEFKANSNFFLMRHHQRTERSEQKLQQLYITDRIIMITVIIASSYRAGAVPHRLSVDPNCPKSCVSNPQFPKEKGLPSFL